MNYSRIIKLTRIGYKNYSLAQRHTISLRNQSVKERSQIYRL